MALLSSTFLGGTFLFSKIALVELNTRSFLAFWMLFGGIYAVIACLFNHERIFPPDLLSGIGLLSIGFIEILISFAFFTAIKIAPQPAIIAFLSQFSYVLSLVLGILVLKEKIAKNSLLGVSLIVIGSLALSYATGPVGWVLMLLIGIATTALALSLVVSKLAVKRNSPLSILVVRNLVTSLGAFLILPGSLQLPQSNTWTILTVGAFVGPFCGFLFRYMALARISSWQVSIFSMAIPLFVSIYDYVFLGNLMTVGQLFAGLIVLTGSWFVIKSSTD